MSIFPSIISGGLNLLGGIGSSLFGSSEAKKSRKYQERFYHAEAARQKEHAQNFIQWRVEDAKKAGIHPLAALGAAGSGSTIAGPVGAVGDGSALGSGIAAMGDQLGAGIERSMGKKHKAKLARIAASRSEEAHRASLRESNARVAKDLAQADMFSVDAQRTRSKIMGEMINRDRNPVMASPLGRASIGPETSAQDVEDKYGGIVGEVAGLSALGADTYRHFRGPVRELFKREGRRIRRTHRDRVKRYRRTMSKRDRMLDVPF